MTYFRAEIIDGEEVLTPEPRSRSGWGGRGQLRGTAVSGVLARAAERAADGLDDAGRFRPVRWTVDLFRPAAVAPVATTATVVRSGRRLRLVDASLLQGGDVVARGSVLLLATGGGGAGDVWTTEPQAPPDVPDLAPVDEPMLYFSEGTGWSADAVDHRNGARKRTWHLPEALVDGEPTSAFVRVATVADSSNLVGSWGTRGVEFINGDLTLTLDRLPEPDDGIGIVAEERRESDGIAVVRTSVVDRKGFVGGVVLSTLANSARAVDFGGSGHGARRL